jgi:hypothetical protein
MLSLSGAKVVPSVTGICANFVPAWYNSIVRKGDTYMLTDIDIEWREAALALLATSLTVVCVVLLAAVMP